MSLKHAVDYTICKAQKKLKRLPVLAMCKTLSLKSGQIRVCVKGSGKTTVLLCPDPPCTLEHYQPLIDILAQDYRVVAFEGPGFGGSAPSYSYDYSLNAGASLIDEVLQATATSNVILCLPCVSGLYALNFAFVHPKRVKAVVAIQTADWHDMLLWMNRIDPFRLIRTPVIGQVFSATLPGWLKSHWYGIAEPDSTKCGRYKIASHQHACHFCLASVLQVFKGPDPFSDKILKVPSAILWGKKDRSHRPTPPLSAGKYLQDPALSLVPDAGHFPEMTAPEQLREIIRRF
jgi:pimeloyl-ACP methyl ester carboxylesterase